MNCRHCNSKLKSGLIDLGAQPPSNSFLSKEDLEVKEIYFPLKVFVCHECFLVQTKDFTDRETFFNKDYVYFSSTSASWLKHAQDYVEDVIKKFGFNSSSFVIEVASNDGYLLRNFLENDIPCLGIEPTESTAKKSKELGIETLVEFFSQSLAKEIKQQRSGADLITCNNVYAHVPDINDFTAGLWECLKDDGIVTIEFPHLLNLIEKCQFDTIYHEHYSYLSLGTVKHIFEAHKLKIFDVKELDTHGGSLRVYGCKSNADYPISELVNEIIEEEKFSGLFDMDTFIGFQNKAEKLKLEFLKFLVDCKINGKKVCGYGAAAKGNTLINFAGVKRDMLPFVADAAASKINMFLPGSRIPVQEPSTIINYDPDFVIIFPWNIASEIKVQLKEIVGSKCKFVTFVPEFREV